MIKSQRVFHFLKLTIFFSFFSFTFTSLLLMFSSAINRLLENTFLSMFVSMLGTFINVFFIGLRYLSFAFMIGALIGLFIVFYLDFVKKQFVN